MSCLNHVMLQISRFTVVENFTIVMDLVHDNILELMCYITNMGAVFLYFT